MTGLKVMQSLRVRMIALLFVLSFVNYLLRNNLSAAQSEIGREYSLSATEIGWILWSFNFTYALFQLPGGMFGDRFGSRMALTICAVSWGVLTFLTGWVPGLFAASAGGAIASLMIVRLLMGAMQAPIFPLTGVMVSKWFPAGRWAVPNAVLNTALTLGQAAIGPVFTYLIVEFGWRQAFYVVSPLAFGAALLWWLFARNSPREHPSITQEELDFIEKTAIADTGLNTKVPLRTVLLNRNVLLLAAGYFCSNYVFYIFANWLFEYLVKQRGFTLLESGLLASVPFLSGAVLATVGGIVCDSMCRRYGATWGCRIPGMIGLILTAGFLLGGVYSMNPSLALALLALCFGFQQFTEGAFWAGTTFAAGPHAGTATGVLNTGGNLPGLLAPLVGFIVDKAGWITAFASGAIFAFLGAALWLFVKLPKSRAAGAVVAMVVLAAAGMSAPQSAWAQKAPASGLKVFISVDMEGIAGVVTADQLGPAGFEYDRFRRFMTDEALAAVRAAKAAGATEIVVADSHGNGESLLIDAFPRDVRIVRSWPRRGGMMGGLDSSFSAAVMIGYHASASSPAGVRAHTVSSATFTRIAVNGQDMSEGALGAAQAGAMGVPVVFVSGDDVAIAELKERIGNIGSVETKKALGFHSAETLVPAEAAARIENGVRAALARVRDFKPYVVSTPITLELSYKHYATAETMSYLPGTSRVGSRTIRYVTPDIATAVDFIFFAESYQPDLTP